MKPLLVSEPASREFTEAVQWYEERRPGWGVRLFDAVSHAFDLIERYPLSFTGTVQTTATSSPLLTRVVAQVIGQIGTDRIHWGAQVTTSYTK